MGYVFGVLFIIGAACFCVYSVLKLIATIKERKAAKAKPLDDKGKEEEKD